jgi:uncharacterized protein YqjF (DUF2071 family)
MARPFLTAEWRHLVMLNYEVNPIALNRYLPCGVELDSWHGRHFVSVVGFMFYKTKLLGLPIPFHRTFPEVNLRFYVVRRDNDDIRRGVVFIREVAPRRAVCFVARQIYNEQYYYSPIEHQIRMPRGGVGQASYSWRWSGGEIQASAEFAGKPQPPETGSLEEFIAEHYWAYTRQRDGGTKEYHVTHPPWRIWPAKAHRLTGDAAGFYGSTFAGVFDQPPVSPFVADGSAVAVYRGHRLPE